MKVLLYSFLSTISRLRLESTERAYCLGTTYKLQCSYHDNRTRVGAHMVESFAACKSITYIIICGLNFSLTILGMEKCSATESKTWERLRFYSNLPQANCNSVKYTAREVNQEPVGTCALFKEGGPAKNLCPEDLHDFA